MNKCSEYSLDLTSFRGKAQKEWFQSCRQNKEDVVHLISRKQKCYQRQPGASRRDNCGCDWWGANLGFYDPCSTVTQYIPE